MTKARDGIVLPEKEVLFFVSTVVESAPPSLIASLKRIRIIRVNEVSGVTDGGSSIG